TGCGANWRFGGTAPQLRRPALVSHGHSVVNAAARVASWPSGFSTTTSLAPSANPLSPVVHVSSVVDTSGTGMHGTPPVVRGGPAATSGRVVSAGGPPATRAAGGTGESAWGGGGGASGGASAGASGGAPSVPASVAASIIASGAPVASGGACPVLNEHATKAC